MTMQNNKSSPSPRAKKPRPILHAEDYALDVTSGDTDMFRWFLLTYLLGKPIQVSIAVQTWHIFIERKLDTPWAIMELSQFSLARTLDDGKYTRYDEITARGLQLCMERLIREYEGSLLLMYESSVDEDEFAKRLQELHGVGPKTAEAFMRETQELFARRVE